MAREGGPLEGGVFGGGRRQEVEAWTEWRACGGVEMRGCYDVGVVCGGGPCAKGAAWRGSVGEGGDGLVVWWVRRVMCGEGVMGRRERVLVRDGMSVVAAWWCRCEGRTERGGEAAPETPPWKAEDAEGGERGCVFDAAAVRRSACLGAWVCVCVAFGRVSCDLWHRQHVCREGERSGVGKPKGAAGATSAPCARRTDSASCAVVRCGVGSLSYILKETRPDYGLAMCAVM